MTPEGIQRGWETVAFYDKLIRERGGIVEYMKGVEPRHDKAKAEPKGKAGG